MIRSRVVRCAFFAILLVTSVSTASAQVSDFALKNGDRVVFFGDSITEQRLYTSFVEQFVLSRYPTLNVTFINSGWGGDTVWGNPCVPCAGVGALARIERDVIAHKPTVVTLLFGMNDGLYQDFDPAVLKRYTDGLTEIIHIIKSKTHARIYVMTPTVYDGSRHTWWSHTDKYNNVLDEYSEAAKEIAVAENLPVIDLHLATVIALDAAKQADPEYTFVEDGVHPGPDGQMVMAAEILRAWGAPQKGAVQTIKLDASKAAAQLPLSTFAPLPWPTAAISQRIRQADPKIDRIGGISLEVRGLLAGTYTLTLDGKSVGSYSASQLEAGVPIGTLSEEAQKASAELLRAVERKEEIEFMRWRNIQLGYGQWQRSANAVHSVDELADEVNTGAHSLARPRKYEITLSTESAGKAPTPASSQSH